MHLLTLDPPPPAHLNNLRRGRFLDEDPAYFMGWTRSGSYFKVAKPPTERPASRRGRGGLVLNMIITITIIINDDNHYITIIIISTIIITIITIITIIIIIIIIIIMIVTIFY